MLLHTAVKVIDNRGLDLLSTVPAIFRLITNILIELLILYLMC